MTTKTINTYIAAGYTLSSAYSRLVITASGGIGGTGLLAGSYARVFNDGVVHGHHASNGIVLDAGGLVQNGAATVTGARIRGAQGVFVTGGAGTVVNYGTIVGGGRGGFKGANAGIDLRYGGSVTNGAPGDTTARIGGYDGIVGTRAAVSVANYGEIGGSVDGIILRYGTVTNFGTISGGLRAVSFASPSDVLVVQPGSAFLGAIYGGGGTLDLPSGEGTLTLAGGSVTVSGSMAPTTFGDFGTVEVGARATFSSSGAVTIAAGQTLIDSGSLTLGGAKTTVVNAGLIETSGSGVLTVRGAVKNTGLLSADGGILTVNGPVTGKGAATINGGTLDFVSSFNEAVTFTGKTGILELAQSPTFTGAITGFSKTGGTSLDLDDIAFVSAGEATYSGTKTGGVLTVTDGTHTAHIKLTGNYLSSAFVAASDGHGGVIVHDPTAPTEVPPPHGFIAAMAGFGADRGGFAHMASEARFVHPSMLAVPKMAMA